MNKETIKAAREALDNLDDYARMNTGVNAIGPRAVLESFISEVERTTSPVSQIADETIIQIAKRELRSEGNLFEGDADEVAVFVRECLAAAAPHAQSPAAQQESIDGPEFQELVGDHASTYLDYSGSFAEERAMKTMKYLIEFIDAHTAAAVAKAAQDKTDYANLMIEECRKLRQRAERAEAALAQPVDLSKLTRYGFDGTLGGDFGKNNLGPYVKLSDVEQLLAAAPAAPVAAPHPDDIAVDKFAAAMKAKMAVCRAKGRGGWDDPAQCDVADLCSMLVDHVEKGDPVDVGNFAMMLFNRGVKSWELPTALAAHIAPAAQPQPVAEQDERAAFEAWAKYCGLRLDMATHQFAWEGWKARATAAEEKLEAIRQGVRECVGFGFDKDGPNWISRQKVLDLLQPQPQTGRVSYQDCGTGTQSVRQLAASMIQLNEPECELAFVENGRRINIYVKILRVLEQESDESGLPR